MILAKQLENCDVIVFGCPNSSKLRPAEIDVLKKFVAKGGGLMLLSLSGGDRGLMNNMSQLSKHFGITFENTAVKDERNNAGLPTMPIISGLVAHPVTDDVNDILLPSGCSLKVTEKAIVIATTSDAAEPASQPVIAIAEHKKGKVMCVGSYEVFRRGGGFKHKGNKAFAVNAFRWLSGELTIPKPSEVAQAQAAETATVTVAMSDEVEKTLKRLVNAVFDLQKDISNVTKHVASVESNVESLRGQFQDFAEKTQSQLGLIIPAGQFKSEEESKTSETKADIKALEKEIKSVTQLREHVEQRHASGAMDRETYEEQITKLDKRVASLEKKLQKKENELAELMKPPD